MLFLYPQVITLNTKPLQNKLYAFRFNWETTESIGEESIKNGFDALLAWWQNTYDILTSWSVLGIEGHLGPEVAFKSKRDLDVTMGDLWSFLKVGASDYYLDLTFNEAILYKPRTPWWVWLVLAGIGGGTIYAFKKGE